MNKFCLLFFAIFAVSCHANENLINGCSANKSDEVFFGKFNASDVKCIGIVESNQKSIYPIPDPKTISDNKIISNNNTIVKFRDLLINPKNKNTSLNNNFYPSFHIFVFFKSGNHACLFGRIGNNGFLIQPMFDADSYAANNNEIYNFFASEIPINK